LSQLCVQLQWTPLGYALEKGKREIVQILLEHKAAQPAEEGGDEGVRQAADLSKEDMYIYGGRAYSMMAAMRWYLRAAAKGHTTALETVSSRLPRETSLVLRAAVNLNDKSVMEFVVGLKDIDLNTPIDDDLHEPVRATDVLTYAMRRGCTNVIGVLQQMCLEKALRVMFVGQEGSGKTQLRQLVAGCKYHQGVTELMDITDVVLERGARVRLIDFAGQAGHYAGQQFFVGSVDHERLLTVVCVDVRKSKHEMQDEMRTWLERVCRTKGERALVAFVATHCDACNSSDLAAQLAVMQGQVTVVREHYAGSLELLLDEKREIWQSGVRGKWNAWRALRQAIVERCLASTNRLAAPEVIATLTRVKEACAGGKRAVLLSQLAAPGSEDEDRLRLHLEKLHGLGEVFYRPGAKAVSVDVRLALNVFKGLLRACGSGMEPVHCHVWWG
jgi:hypothetical protein